MTCQIARLATAIVVAAVVTACAKTDESRGFIFHPNPSDVIAANARSVRIELGEATHAGALLGRLSKAQLLSQLGETDGPLEETLGRVEDVAVDGVGNTYVLDSHFGRVRILGEDGRLIESVGADAQGRAELRKPISLAIDGSGVIYIGGIDRRLVTYVPTDGGHRLGTRRRLHVAPRDMCWIGDELIVHGVDPDNGTTLHRFGSGDRQLASFGQVYSTRNRLITSGLSQGLVACFPRQQIIVLALRSVLPQVRAYSLDGRPLWIAELGGYIPIIARERPGGGLSVRIPPDGYHRVHQLLTLDADHLLLQVATVEGDRQSARRAYKRLQSFVVNVSTGAVVESADDVEPIGAMLTSRLGFVGVQHAPSTAVRLMAARP